MKYFIIFMMACSFQVSFVHAGEKVRLLLGKDCLEVTPSEGKIRKTASMFRRMLEYRKSFPLNNRVRLLLVTPGFLAKHKIRLGEYPECYPARFSVKIQYKF